MWKLPRASFDALALTDDDPLRFYYSPLTAYFYWKRLALAHRFIEARPDAQRCLELACGSGVFLPSLSRHAKQLHAVDLAADLKAMRGMLAKEGIDVHVQRADITRLPYAGASFDLVVGMSCLEHLREPKQAIDEVKRVLRPGGTVLLGVPIETFALNLFFKLVGFDHDGVHVSTHDEVLHLARASFRDVELSVFPPGLPLSASLYLVIKGTC